MAIIQISKIQHRTGNIDDLPQLSVGELGWASDAKRLFIGNDPNVLGPDPDNTEILTQWSDLQAAGSNTTVQFNQEGMFSGSNAFTFDFTANTLALAGDFVPMSNGVFDLGSATSTWGNLYLSGNSLYVGGQHIFVSSNALTTTNVTVTNTLIASNLSSQNISIAGNLSVGLSGSFGGNVSIAGNLGVSGNITYYDIATLRVSDPIIEMGGGANGAPLTSNDGKDRGTLLHYYTTQPVDAFMGWDNSGGEFIFGSNVTNINEVITINTLGNIRAGTIYGNIIGNVSGNVTVPGSNTQVMFNYLGNLGASANFVFTGTSVNVIGIVNATNFVGNGANLTSLTGANVTGTVASATYATSAGSATTAGTVTTAAQPNITSVGTLTSLTVSGNISGNNVGGIIRPTAGNGTAGIIFPADPGGGSGDLATIQYYVESGESTVLELKVTNDVISPSGPDYIRLNAVGGTTIDNTLTVASLSAGSVSTPGSLTGNWTLSGGSRLNSTYADLAEFYLADKKYEPGTVLAFGGKKEVTVTNSKNYQKIAGVVSTNPAYIMNVGMEKTGVCIALIGRVPVKVSGQIAKGDLLRASDKLKGVAVNHGDGGVIGRAIQEYDSDEVGVIEVMVGRA